MSLAPVIFRVASLAAGRRLLKGLAEAFASRSTDLHKRRATLLDTFDWRLCRDGGTLAIEHGGSGDLLAWTSGSGEQRHRLPVDTAPGFVWDLPDCPMRRALEPIVEMRRLLPVASTELSVRGLEILDELEKTVCRVTLEWGKVVAARDEGTTKRLAPVLRVAAVRGYEPAGKRVLRHLDAEFDTARCDLSEPRRIATACGLRPCDVPAKQAYDVRRGMRADEALKAIHRALLDTFHRNEAGMREDLDSEFVHDARVAVRRTRSALSQLTGVYPDDVVDYFKSELRWLGGITGPTRDLDVYLLNIPGYRAALDAERRADLDPLVELLRERQQAAHRQMVVDLDTPRFAKLMRDWDAFLNKPLPRASELPNAMRPVDEVANERIWRAFRKVIKRGRAIGPDSPAELLHRLRIDCKKLRYLLEFFVALYDKQTVGRLIGALKKLQTNLGDLNDLDVQVEALRGFEEELAERKAGAGTLAVIESLVEQLEQRRGRERAAFDERFAEFSSSNVRKVFRRLFRS